MKIRKIITKSNEDIAILIKRGTELISITVDTDNNIEINGYENAVMKMLWFYWKKLQLLNYKINKWKTIYLIVL